jgi:hypothetical protein
MKTFLLGFLLLYSFYIYSQDIIGVRLGLGIPVGSFGKSELDNKDAAFAMTGFSTELNYTYMKNRNLGLMLMYSYQNNPLDVHSLVGESLYNDSEVESKGWRFNRFYGGIITNFALDDRLRLTPRLLLGMQIISTPELYFKSQSGNLNTNIIVESETDLAFGYLVGVGGQIIMSDLIDVCLTLDYTNANSKFNNNNVPTGTLLLRTGINFNL